MSGPLPAFRGEGQEESGLPICTARFHSPSPGPAPCHASGLDARGGARVSGLDLAVVGRPTPTAACGFLTDGFESGDLAAWSAKRP